MCIRDSTLTPRKNGQRRAEVQGETLASAERVTEHQSQASSLQHGGREARTPGRTGGARLP
eukprot:1864891-Alexandrium_andersonii.AAC.1